MRALLFIALATLSTSAHAGIGGYSSTTCVSKSTRTVFTFNQDDAGEAVATLVMDGQPAVYNTSDKTISVDDQDAGTLVSKANNLMVQLIGRGTTRNLIVDADPRVGTTASKNAKSDRQSIPVVCKSFVQEP